MKKDSFFQKDGVKGAINKLLKHLIDYAISYLDDIEKKKWCVYGVEVYEDGTLTHSWGDTDNNLHDIYSATKTVESISAGLAYDRGLIDFSRSILDYLPEDKVEMMSQGQKDTFKKITVNRLLTMSVDGFPFRPEGDAWLDQALSCKIKKPEERIFNYSNISTFLVGVALTEALGEDLGKFIEREIFKPLGICNYEYARSPEGYFYGASGMKLTVHDLSKFGLLLYNKGVYEGRRIVSGEYVEMATSVQQMNREGGYGFYIWKYREGFSINGKWKQKCYVLPQRRIIVTYLSHIEDDSHDLLDSMERNILELKSQ